MNNNTKRYVYLDDFRIPEDSFYHTHNPIYVDICWDVIRNYDEFVKDVLMNGVADGYSFDHDLANFHYDITADTKTEKTGYHCAKWLIEHCMDKNIELPRTILIHSMNVQGSLNIKSLFDSYYKSLDLPSSGCVGHSCGM